MGISRGEGYRRGAPKEEAGLAAVEQFFAATVGVSLSRVEDAIQNYDLGDFVAPSGESVECKRQPIDPDRYKKNFVEVCEATSNPRHADGLAQLADTLHLDISVAANIGWSPAGSRTRYRMEGEPFLSVSIHTFRQAAIVTYVNPGAHLYVYDAAELLGLVRTEAVTTGFLRGMGNSNVETFAVLVPVAGWRWSAVRRRPNTDWIYAGEGFESAAVDKIRRLLAV